MKRVFWILITPTLVFLILWALGTWIIMPKLESWALNEIKTFSDNSLPVRIKAERLHLRILRPSLTLENIEITPKKELESVLKSAHIGSIRVHLDLFQLLGGRLTLSALIVESPEAHLVIDDLLKGESKPKEIPLDDIFAITEKIPLDKIYLQNLHLMVESKKLGFLVETQNGGILVTNMGKNLTAKVDVPDLKMHLEKVGDFAGSFDTHLYLTRQSLRIIQLGVRMDESELIARGELTHFRDIMIRPSGVMNISAKIELNNISQEIAKLRPDLHMPNFEGELSTEIDTHFSDLNTFGGKAEINTRSLKVAKFQLGDAKILGEFKNRSISFSEMKISHPAGEASLKQSEIELDKDFNFKSRVKVDSLDLQKLFASINLPGIPAGLEAEGELPCEGQIFPSLHVKCDKGTLKAKNIWVKSENNAKGSPILNLNGMAANGSVDVTMQAVSYNVALQLGDNDGTSDGVIDFSKGFKINFKTKKLDFKNVQNLANLKIEGNAGLEGSTEGDSSYATFNMKVAARDFIFEDFNLGNLTSNLTFRKGHLQFDDVVGSLNKTQYIGDLDVDLGHSQISGDFSAPSIDLNDVTKIFERIYKFPMDVQGTGVAKAHINGPLNFWKMNYRLESAFKPVIMAGETFDQMIFNVDAAQGNIKANKVQLTRNQSSVIVHGGISSDQVMNLSADAKNWKLEEFSTINKVNSSILGLLNVSAELKDSVHNPHIMAKGSVTDTVLEDQEIPPSAFILRLDRRSFGGQLSLWGDKVQGDFQIPYSKGSSPLIVKMKTNNWNFSTLLALVGGASLATDYDSSLTSTIDLHSDSGELTKATGKIHAQTLLLKRGHLTIANATPIDISMDNGVINLKNFLLQGPHNKIQIRGDGFTAERLDLSVNAELDLRILQIFMPFLDDLGGPLKLSTNISGKLEKPEILGTAKIDNGFLKLKGFPHPFEKFSTDVNFSQSKIIVNSIRSQVAGGTMTGDGGVVINGLKDMPVSIRGHLEGVTFEVPEKVRTSGNADVLFSGRWFPFTLSGTYHVTDGLMEKEVTDDSGGGVTGIRQSAYLPKVIRQNNFEPVLLDLQIVLDRPIQIKNSLLDGAVSGQLQVKGAPTNPILLGRITTEKKSRLLFKDRIFDIQSGTIDFNDPNEINPAIYITAQSRINEYDIFLVAQGASKNLAIHFTSTPPLSDQDIISLIALGVTSSTSDQTAQSKFQAEQTSYEIGGAVLAKPINKQLESTLGMNLQVTSQFDSTRNISVPKLTLSKRVSEKVKASASREVGDSQNYDMKLEYQLNSNITAIGSFENRATQDANTLQNTQQETLSIFGLDLEFKREFK